MVRPSTRLAAGTLVLALPLAAAAGCGAAKKRTIKQEFAAAQSNLENASAVSMTLRFKDAKGNTLKAVTKGEDAAPEAIAKELLGGSVTVTTGSGSGKLKDVKIDPNATEQQLQDAVKGINIGISVKDTKTTVAEIRLVDSTLYARVDFAEIDRLATAAGQEGFDASYDDFVDSAPAEVQPALKDAKAGKWLKLPLSEYIGKLKDLSGALPTPSAGASVDTKKLQNDVIAAVKPYVKVTEANGGKDDRVLSVDVDARPAAKALLTLLKSEKDLPFAGFLGDVSPTDVDDNLADGKAHGTITLSDGHLKQVTIDIDSIRKLDPEPGTTDLAGSDVVLDVDDSADAVKAPTDNVSTVDVKATVESLFQDFFGGVSESFSSSATIAEG